LLQLVCLRVGLLTRLCVNFHEIFGTCRPRDKKQSVSFWDILFFTFFNTVSMCSGINCCGNPTVWGMYCRWGSQSQYGITTGTDMSMLGQPWQKFAHSEWFLVRTANLCISLVLVVVDNGDM